MELKELSDTEFNNFIKAYPIKSIFQTNEYGNIKKNQNYTVIKLGLINKNQIIAATLVTVKKENGFLYAYSNRGFLIDYENLELLKTFTDSIINYLGNKNIIAIKICPLIYKNIYNFKTQKILKNSAFEKIFNNLKSLSYYHLGFNNYFEALNNRFEAVVNLNIPIEYLFKNLNKKTRTKIRSAINNGIKTYRGNVNDFNIFKDFTFSNKIENIEDYFKEFKENIELYYTKIDTVTYLKNIQKNISFYENKLKLINDKILKNDKYINKKISLDKKLNKLNNDLIKATTMLRNNPNGIITSMLILLKQDKQLYILIDGYNKKYKYLNSKDLLIWQIINDYKKLNYDSLNMGGISNITIDNAKYKGLDEFKLGFGSEMYEYIGDFEIITNKKNYNLYRKYIPIKNLFKIKKNNN